MQRLTELCNFFTQPVWKLFSEQETDHLKNFTKTRLIIVQPSNGECWFVQLQIDKLLSFNKSSNDHNYWLWYRYQSTKTAGDRPKAGKPKSLSDEHQRRKIYDTLIRGFNNAFASVVVIEDTNRPKKFVQNLFQLDTF